MKHAVVLRSWAVFVGVLGSLLTILHWAHVWVDGAFSAWTAQGTAAALSLLGADGRSNGSLVVSSVFSFNVVGECTAAYPLALFLAAVVAFPCAWQRKLLGVMWGVPAILLINVIRLVSLCYVARWFPAMYEVIHLVVWQALIVFFVLLVWLVWATLAVKPDALEAA